MVSNPITNRAHIFAEYSPSEEKYIIPDLNLTITTVVICIMGPFWFIFKFAKHIIGQKHKFSHQINQKTKLQT